VTRDQGPSLEEAAPWIEKHRGSRIVVKIGGEILALPKHMDRIAGQAAALLQLGIMPIIVHGAGIQVDEECRRRGVEIVKIGGRRVTSEGALDAAIHVLTGLNRSLVESLRRHGANAKGMDDGVQNAVKCLRRAPTIVDGRAVDWGFVGNIQSVDLSGEDLVVLPSLGVDETGHVVNVNADAVAAHTAMAVGAAKIVYLTGAPGVMMSMDDDGPISQMDAATARELIDKGVVQGGMKAKLEESLRALDGGVGMVHVVSGREPHALLRELFTDEGCGTLIAS
jgi:acetylglutamate kinase